MRTTFYGQTPVNEYDGQIDFRFSENSGKWQISTLIRCAEDTKFSEGLMKMRLFDKFHMNLQALSTGEKMMVSFQPVIMNPLERKKARRILLAYLQKHRWNIIWKEGEHGYEINKSGRVSRKWKLNKVYGPNNKKAQFNNMSMQVSYDKESFREIREYIDIVDFTGRQVDLQKNLSSIRGIICTHIIRTEVGDFSDGLIKRGLLTYFTMEMKPLESNDKRAWIQLKPRIGKPTFHAAEAVRALWRMLKFLDSRPLPIIWKEDNHGYVIDPNGMIKRKWQLHPY